MPISTGVTDHFRLLMIAKKKSYVCSFDLFLAKKAFQNSVLDHTNYMNVKYSLRREAKRLYKEANEVLMEAYHLVHDLRHKVGRQATDGLNYQSMIRYNIMQKVLHIVQEHYEERSQKFRDAYLSYRRIHDNLYRHTNILRDPFYKTKQKIAFIMRQYLVGWRRAAAEARLERGCVVG